MGHNVKADQSVSRMVRKIALVLYVAWPFVITHCPLCTMLYPPLPMLGPRQARRNDLGRRTLVQIFWPEKADGSKDHILAGCSYPL